MNWIRDVVTPKIKALINSSQSKVEDNMWTKCPVCEKMIYTKELDENLNVCGYCSHHFSLLPKKRFDSIFDNQEYQIIENIDIKDDPLKFKDTKKYTDRLKDARVKTGNKDALLMAFGKIGEKNAVVFIMNFAFMGGSMGLAVGKSFSKAVEFAIKNRAAFISFTASGGARMQEGMLSLMQMPATIASVCDLKEEKLPFINVFTNPTTGGVLASFATIGDLHIAEPKALIGFAGRRVIEKTIKQNLPDDFQKSEFLKDHGLIDMIVERKDLKDKLASVLDYLII